MKYLLAGLLLLAVSVVAQPAPGGRISGPGGGSTVNISVSTNGIIASTNLPFLTNTFGITIDGSGIPFTTGVKGYLEVPYDCKIIQATLMADQNGGCGINVWRTNSVGFPPTNTYTISAATSPRLQNTNWMRETTLSGWSVNLTNNDFLGFNVESNDFIQRITLTLKVIHAQ